MKNKLFLIVLAAIGIFFVLNNKRIDRVSFDTKTLLGKIDVSLVTYSPNETSPQLDNFSTYNSPQYGFRLSWPNNGKWTTHSIGSPSEWPAPIILPGRGTPSYIPIYLSRSYPFELNHPQALPVSMYVGVEQLQKEVSISEYTSQSLARMESFGWSLLNSSIDENTQSAAVTFVEKDASANPAYRYDRFVVKGNRAFVLEAHFFTNDTLSQDWKQEVVQIFNSFQVAD